MIVLAAFILFTCSKQKEQIEKFVFDKKQINNQSIYTYTFYPTGKIKTKVTTLYYYFNGVVIDSSSFQERLFYNSKGLVSKIESEELSEYNFYNNTDSLIAKYLINSFGDTIRYEKNQYINEVLKQRIIRLLSPKLTEDITRINFRDFDTIYSKINFEIINDTLQTSQTRDVKNQLLNEFQSYYKNKIIVKTVEFAFLGDQRYVKNITHYDTVNLNTGDFFTLTPNGDTVELQKTVFKDNSKVIGRASNELKYREFEFYNKQNQLTKSILEKNTEKKRDIFTYAYDANGNCIEVINITERILDE